MPFIYYKNGYAYWSNSFLLFKQKCNYPKELEGKTEPLDKDTKGGKAPDYEFVLKNPLKEVATISKSELSKEDIDTTVSKKRKTRRRTGNVQLWINRQRNNRGS